jgi:hypothetical protein
MIVQCPNCGKSVVVNGLGSKTFNKPVTKVCDALSLQHSVLAMANKIRCNRAYIYKVLKADGLTLAVVIKGLATEYMRKLCFEG